MSTAVILLALFFWVAVCWLQYRYTASRRAPPSSRVATTADGMQSNDLLEKVANGKVKP
jgi:hypothetical protein